MSRPRAKRLARPRLGRLARGPARGGLGLGLRLALSLDRAQLELAQPLLLRLIPLRLLGLDSNLVEGPDAGGIGYVGTATLDHADALLRRDDAQSGADTQARIEAHTWVVVHHHLFPATSPGAREALEKRISLFADASELLYHAHRWQTEAILHGHEHQPSITVAQRWAYPPRSPGDPTFSSVISAGAGSFALGSHLGPIGRNHYYVIHRRPQEICFHSRILDAHGIAFTHHDHVRVDLKSLKT